ncbi:MAG TPA: helix-turn-helix transcriptional regulator [Candidatus Acidoferrum sp.]
MLPSKRILSQLIESLYQAASEPRRWEKFLGDFAGLTKASSAALLVHNTRDHQHNVVMQFGFDPEDLHRYYDERSDLRDVWTSRALAVSHSGWAGFSEALVEPDELVKTAFYNESLRNLKVHRGLFGVIQQDPGLLANIALYRPAGHAAFGTDDMDLLEFLIPHLRLAFQLHFRLKDLQQQNAVARDAMDLIGGAIFFLNSAGKIFLMNGEAREMVGVGAGLRVTRDELCAEGATENERLKELVKRALAHSVSGGLQSAGTLRISRQAGPPLQVMVSPVKATRAEVPAEAAAIAFVVDPGRRIRGKDEIVREMFGFTAAESRVALLLGEGKSLAEISSVAGVSKNTVKTQVANIYAKTGTSRQSQVVRALLQLPL